MSLTNDINIISDKVLALEQENELLKQQLTDNIGQTKTQVAQEKAATAGRH